MQTIREMLLEMDRRVSIDA